MLNKRAIRFSIFGAIILLVIIAGTSFIVRNSDAADKTQNYDDLHVGSMHPWIAGEGAGECNICGMALSKVDGHQDGTPLPPVDNLYVSPSNPMYVHEGPGNDPKTGDKLIPIKESPYYQEPEDKHSQDVSSSMDEHDHSKHQTYDSGSAGSATDEASKLYTCGMHPDVIQEEPGTCPICGMNLTPIKSSGSSSGSGERTVAYWVAPMDPGYISDQPGKSPMGMDLVPVYENELNEGTVQIDPVTLQSIGVRTEKAQRQNLTRTIRSNGIIQVAEDTEFKLNSRVSGWVEEFFVSRTGDYVTKGQPMLEIYSPELVAAQEEFLIALNSMQDNSEIDKGKNNSDTNVLLSAAKRRLQLWDISDEQIDILEQTRKVKRSMILVSPGNGIVLHKNVVNGSAIKPGMDLFRIADLSKVWVIAQIYEYELPWIKLKDLVEVNSPFDPSVSVKGRIDYIYPTLDPRTRTVDVRIVLSNPGIRFKPEMYVDVHINTSSRNGVIAIPKSSIIRSGERDIVFIQRGRGRFEPIEVKIGLESGRYYEITRGVHEGDEVVTSAQFLLDSESKLQEAIQRRIEQRRQMKQAGS
ncbi:MAG: efflux RND transporter periplasmic adaptor subunit [Candidatus Electryonea clarkiae]|nr:efflux RND transporter periplasmic adaptor subunit [Candidatus Electryonea clarkiae]MDP8289194.1 efflux RND transporter periplasmic adaptor subunit [Candidatus Electryonea clarkiae]